MQTLTAPALPGTPASPAEEQMVAKLERIDALYRIAGLGRMSPFVERDDIITELQEVIDDLLWNDGDGSLALADAADEAARELPLEVEYSGRWSAGAAPAADQVIITFTVGGPTCWISAPLNPYGSIITNEAAGHFSWSDDKGSFFIPDRYHDALRWFADLVAA